MQTRGVINRCRWDILLLLSGLLAVGGLAAAQDNASGLITVPHDGFNLVVTELLSPTYAILKLSVPNHGWFAGTFTNLPTEQPVTFGWSMDGNDDQYPADVTKWKGLRPVMTYADPTRYESYIGYTRRKDGRWIAANLFRTRKTADAGAGPLPSQTVIPEPLATQFLSTDGSTWYPWREMTTVQTLSNVNIFRVTETFVQPTATLAMRVPYTYTYLQAFLEQLRQAKPAGVTIDIAGLTPEQRQLVVIRLEPPHLQSASKERPTILIYAREHATEPEGSWVIEGVLQWLLSHDAAAKTARQQCDWLLIPMLDPDCAAQARCASGDLFNANATTRTEGVAYATYLVNWIDAGHRLEVVINLHNVECTEGPNLFTPMVNAARETQIRPLQQPFFTAADKLGFTTGQPGWSMVGYASFRLSGWCYNVFRTFDMFYEVNGRAPLSRLNPVQLRQIGNLLAQHSYAVVGSPTMGSVRAEINKHLSEREVARNKIWQRNGRDAQSRTVGELLTYGY